MGNNRVKSRETGLVPCPPIQVTSCSDGPLKWRGLSRPLPPRFPSVQMDGRFIMDMSASLPCALTLASLIPTRVSQLKTGSGKSSCSTAYSILLLLLCNSKIAENLLLRVTTKISLHIPSNESMILHFQRLLQVALILQIDIAWSTICQHIPASRWVRSSCNVGYNFWDKA